MRLPTLTTTLLLALLAPGIAAAQVQPNTVLSGTASDENGAPLADTFIRVWKLVDAKGWRIDYEFATAVDGTWSVAVPPGTYKVEAGAGPAAGGNYGGRWYDIADPVAGGWVGDDADEIVAVPEVDVPAIDISLEPGGGVDIEVTDSNGTRISAIEARLMRLTDPRLHHNDYTKGSAFGNAHLGRFYMRGLRPSDDFDTSDYGLALYDPSGTFGLTVSPATYTVDEGDNLPYAVVLDPFPADPFEPNNTRGALGAFSVDGAGLHDSPPQPWAGTGTIAAGGDPDWYCWASERGDRYLLATESMLQLPESAVLRNPWLDPMLSLWDVTGGTPVLLFEDDDSGPGRQAFIDTLDIPFDGELCAAVTTYGDPEFDGTGQESIGTYDLSIDMGNRRPLVIVTEDGIAVPEPPSAVVAIEDVELVLDVALEDPEGDTPYAIATFADADGQPVPGWTFDLFTTDATFTWTPGPLAAYGSPYLLTIEAGDFELSVVTEVLIGVATANTPPELPDPLAPEDGGTVDVWFPELSIVNGFDADGDPLAYQFEVYLNGDISGAPWDDALVDEDSSGVTSYDMPFVPDTTEVWWRARSWDGQSYSAWTPFWVFGVEAVNDPPSVPVLDKPLMGDRVMVRRPSLTVRNSFDAENDLVDVEIEVGLDTTFATPVASSGPIPENPGMLDTSWSLDVDLPWGADVYWRARAVDSRGASSAWSDTFWFAVKQNVEPTIPRLDAPWGPTCEDTVLASAPSVFTVRNAVDPENEAMTLELRVYDADVPLGGASLLTAFAPQSGGATTDIPIAGSPFDEDEHYRVEVRADDGTSTSGWDRCTFWLDSEDAPPEGLEITAPVQGDVLPFNTVTVMAEVTNPVDPDGHLPGASLVLAWCLNHADNTCMAEPAEWNQLAFHDGEVTAFQVAGLFEDQQWTLTACALDQDGTCAATDAVAFSTDEDDRPTEVDPEESGCGCGGGPVTGWWVLAAAAMLRRRRAREA